MTATLDAARALIADADAERPPVTAAEASVRDWWAGRRGSASGGPGSGIQAARALAERRWPMAFTLVLAIAVPLLLPARFSLGPSWGGPTVEALLLVAIIATDRGRIDRRSAVGRVLSLGLIAVLVAEAAGVCGRLVVDLVEGGPETNSAADLLKTGFLVWFYTIIAFAFLYWGLDGGGPESRFLAPREFPDLAFPRSSTRGWLRVAGALILRLPVPRLYRRHRLQPDRCDAACPLGQTGHDGAGIRLPRDSRPGNCPGGQHLEVVRLRRCWLSSISCSMTVPSLAADHARASEYPSISAVNPALTAMANAIRVGDHLLERLG